MVLILEIRRPLLFQTYLIIPGMPLAQAASSFRDKAKMLREVRTKLPSPSHSNLFLDIQIFVQEFSTLLCISCGMLQL